jgi:glycosyltransferase involved in cell wall biosynthesis
MTWLNRATRPLAAVTIANSRAVARRVEERDGIRPRVIYGGVDLDRFSQRPQDKSATLDVVTVLRLERYKGIFDLIDAMAQLVAKRPETRLGICGTGAEERVVASAIHDRGFGDRVVLFGAEEDVPRRLREANLFVLPSHEEGLPNAVLEAMACGLPVVGTRVGGTPELVEDGVTGTLVPPRDSAALADAMLRYLNDSSLMDAHGRAARARVSARFDVVATVRAYEALYVELVGTS